MHVVVTCCGCSRQLRLPKNVIGGTVRCPLCKAIFLTRALDDDRAAAIPLQEKEKPAPAPPKPEKPEPPKIPRMELDDLPLVPSEADDLVLEVLPVEEEPPARGKKKAPERYDVVVEAEDDDPPEREERRPRRRKDDYDDEDEPEDRVRTRRREGPVLARFPLFVHHDPHDRMHGRFDAEVDPDGLTLWRGKGRLLEVPVGAECEYLGQGRLALPIDGRVVELTPVHPDGLHDELARELEAFLERRQDAVTLPLRPRGWVVWLSLLPFGVPLLAVIFGRSIGGVVGFLVWGLFAALLAAACYLLTMQRSWSMETRGWGAVLVSLVGYFALAIGLRIDAEGGAPPVAAAPHSEWCALAPLDSGYRVEMPGRPVRRAPGFPTLPEPLKFENIVELPPGTNTPDTVFLTAHGDLGAVGFGGDKLLSIAREIASKNGGRVVHERGLTLDGKRGHEVEIDSPGRGTIVARVFLDGRRVFLAAFVSKRLPATSDEAKRFLDSFAFDATTGWSPQPGPR
jgi:hypothetical protein